MSHAETPQDSSRQDEIDELLRRVRTSSEAPDSLDALANEAHYSRFHLSRMLRKHLGFPFRDFMAALKVERGIDVLVEGHEVIRSQTESGHESASSYHHSFLRHTGISPKRYRDQMRFFAAFLIRRMQSGTPLVALHRSYAPDEHRQPHGLTIEVAGGQPGSALFVALNPSLILHGPPPLGIALIGTNSHEVTEIPDGTYYAMVVEAPPSAGVRSYFHLEKNRRQLRREPITFPLDEPARIVLELRELEPSDPPITPNIPKMFFEALAGRVDIEQSNSRHVPGEGGD